MALAYLVGSATQGSADAFVEAQIATALTGIGNVAFRMRELLIELSSPNVLVGGNADLQVQLTRRTKAAIVNVNDRDLIAKIGLTGRFTTSGRWVAPDVFRQTFSEDDELLIVEDPLYLALDSTGTSAAQSAWVRIGYERVSISAVDRLTLLTQSLE